MQQKNINEFCEGDQIEGFYAVKDASLHLTSSGKPYIRMVLSDATGSIGGNMWDGTPELFATFSAGDVIKVRVVVETYRSALQIKVLRLRPAEEGEVDYSLFVPTTSADIFHLKDQLRRFVDSIADPDYAALVRMFFDDPEFFDRFSMAPAAKENHHAYIGGLLEHTVCLLRYADAFCLNSPAKLNRDLLIAGTLMHDMGKIEELSLGAVIDYTDRGKLLGHLIIGSMMVEERAKTLDQVSEIKKILLQHMILSHHGKFEYGSPVLPAVPEALALHHIDNLDAKTIAARRIIEGDQSDNHWTPRSWMLETKLYKSGDPEVYSAPIHRSIDLDEVDSQSLPEPEPLPEDVTANMEPESVEEEALPDGLVDDLADLAGDIVDTDLDDNLPDGANGSANTLF